MIYSVTLLPLIVISTSIYHFAEAQQPGNAVGDSCGHNENLGRSYGGTCVPNALVDATTIQCPNNWALIGDLTQKGQSELCNSNLICCRQYPSQSCVAPAPDGQTMNVSGLCVLPIQKDGAGGLTCAQTDVQLDNLQQDPDLMSVCPAHQWCCISTLNGPCKQQQSDKTPGVCRWGCLNGEKPTDQPATNVVGFKCGKVLTCCVKG